MIFTADNNYLGDTTVSAGRLQMGNGSATGSVIGNINNNGAVAFNRSDDFTFAGTISGIGNLFIDSGIVRFTSPQTYTGNTFISGSYLVLPTSVDQGLSASTGVTLNSIGFLDLSNRALTISGLTGFGHVYSSGGSAGQLTMNNTVDAPSSFGGQLGSGGNPAFAFVKSGPGTFTLTNSNLHTGGTTVNGGTLALSGSNATFGSSQGNLILSGGTLDLGGLTRSAGAVTFTGGSAQNGTLTAGNYDARSGSASAVLAGSSALTKTTSGTFTLSGSNTYAGGTFINDGLINFSSLANFGSGPVTLDGGGLQWAPGNTLDITASGPFDRNIGPAGGIFDTNGNNVTLAGILTGQGSVTKIGSGNLTLSGENTFTGNTIVSGGTLVLGNPLALQSSTLIAPASGALSFGSLTSATLGGLTGSANLTLANASSAPVTLSVGNNGGNTSYTGILSGTSVSGGTLAVSSATHLGPGPIAVTGGDLASSVNFTFDRTVNVTGSTARLSTVGFFEFAVPSSSNATFTVANGGTVTTGSSAAFGNTGGSIGPVTITGSGSRFDVGTKLFLGFAGAGSLTLSSGGTLSAPIISFGEGGGSGTLNLDPGGILELGGSNPIAQNGAGTFNFAGGTLRVTGSPLSTGFAATLSNNSTLDTNGLGATVSSNFSGPGSLTKSGAGTLTLTGSNTYAGGTTVSTGTLQIGSGGSSGSLTGNITNQAALIFNRSDDFTFTVVVSGPSSFTHNGHVLRLAAAQTYTGPTFLNSGYLVLPTSVDQGLAASTTLSLAGSAIIDLSNRALTVAGLSGSGTIYSAGGSSGQLTVNNTTDAPSTFSGIVGGGFSGTPFPNFALTKSGNGTLTLSGPNAYTGGTTINSGTLVMAHPTALGTGSIVLNTSATLDSASYGFNLTRLSGTGGTLSGSGGYTYDSGSSASLNVTLTLTAANTFSGGTTINAGTLQLGSGGTSGSITGNIVNQGVLAIDRSTALLLNGNISGAGSLTKSGPGQLTLAGSNTYTGSTTLNDGTLAIDTAGNLGTGSITINGGTLLASSSFTFNRDITVSGSSAILSASANFDLGTLGGTSSTLDISAGGRVSASGIATFGGLPGSTGTVTITGQNSRLQVGSDLYLGNFSGSEGRLTVGSGGTLIVGRLRFGSTINSFGTLNLNSGGTLTLATPSLAPSADLILEPSTTLDLAFSGTATIDEFYLDGVRQTKGTWSAPGGGTFTTSRISGPGTLTVTRSPATFDSFIAAYFTPAEIQAGVITTQTADPDADGLPNLLEYAFELNPRVANSGVTPVSASAGHLTLTYPRRTDEDQNGLHLFYLVEVSSDLAIWFSGSEFTELVSTVPVPSTNHELQTVRDLVPITSSGHRFIRLSVRLDN